MINATDAQLWAGLVLLVLIVISACVTTPDDDR